MSDNLCPKCRSRLSPKTGQCPRCAAAPESSQESLPTASELTALLAPPKIPSAKPAARAHPPSSALPGQLGPYKVDGELGRGGMGVVLRGSDEKLKRMVAIKMLLPEVTSDPEHRFRFIEEARLTGQLEHPGIVPIHLLGEAEDGREYFSMKLVQGRPLEKILESWHAGDPAVRRDFPLRRLVSIFERIAETVGFAHSRGVLHRDLKPANVMIGDHGEVWVLDWGLAKAIAAPDDRPAPHPEAAGAPRPSPAAGSQLKPPSTAQLASVSNELGYQLTMQGTTMGTPTNMAPEQARGETLDEGADIFGLGAILYEMLTGKTPFTGRSVDDILERAATGRHEPVVRTRAGRKMPRALSAIAEKCLAPERADRYASVAGLVADLRAWSADEQVSACPDRVMDRAWRFARRHRAALATAGAVAAVVLVTVALAATQVAARDRRALDAERTAAAEAERARRAEGEVARRARQRLEAFRPYAEAADLINRGQQPDQAAALLGQALAIDPEFPEAQFALGEALRMGGQPGKAAEAYLAADELSVRISGRPHLQALLAAAFAYDGAGEYLKAEKAFTRAEQLGAEHPLALVGRAFRLPYRGHIDEAQAAAEQAVKLAPHLWETHFARGYVLDEQIHRGKLSPVVWRQEAIASMRRALELSPRQAETCVWLSRCLLQTRDPALRKESVALADRAVALEPRNGNRYLARAEIRYQLKDKAGAMADQAEAERLATSLAPLAASRSNLELREGRYEEACRQAEKAARASDYCPLYVYMWANAASLANRWQECTPALERVAREMPDDPRGNALRAAIKARQKDWSGALAEAEAGLKLAQYNLDLIKLKTNSLAELKRLPEALAAMDHLLQLEPEDPETQAVRINLLIASRRYDDALAAIDEFAKRNPDRSAECARARKNIEALRDKGK